MRIVYLPAARTPAGTRASRAKVCPLAHSGFAEQKRPRFAQLCDDESVFLGDMPFQRQRTRRGAHAVGGVEIVFEQNG